MLLFLLFPQTLTLCTVKITNGERGLLIFLRAVFTQALKTSRHCIQRYFFLMHSTEIRALLLSGIELYADFVFLHRRLGYI